MRDRWLTHMLAAVDALALPPADDLLRDYLERAAHSMVNSFRAVETLLIRKTLQKWTSFSRGHGGACVPVTDVLDSAVLTATLIHPADSPDAAWWRHAVIYQIYPRSWADGDGDGIGDLAGVTARLPYLTRSASTRSGSRPFYSSPQADAGYDVADYRDIDPLFGTLADADAMLAQAHELGLKVIVDLVPNHSSDEHEWFQAALAAGPGSPERERYMFRDGRGERRRAAAEQLAVGLRRPGVDPRHRGGRQPGQWYLHIFDSKQPDFNWEHPEVRAEFESILRFWLDRGVDGFRVDVAHGLIKEQGLPELRRERPRTCSTSGRSGADAPSRPMWDQDGVHEIYRAWRRSSTPTAGRPHPVRRGVGRAGRSARSRYVRPRRDAPGVQLRLPQTPWRAARPARGHRRRRCEAADSVGAPTTWVLSNHDVVRHASRLGLPRRARRA